VTSPDDRDRERESERYRQVRVFGLLSSIPGFLVVPPVVGALAGTWLDKRFHTAPWLTLVFLFLGFGAAVRLIVRTLRRVNEIQDREP
jgi:F0F1-type ATP synthase assembly protein I